MRTSIDHPRLIIYDEVDAGKKSQLGQFMTPSTVARFMAGMFTGSPLRTCRLLDAGAGAGSLSCAFLDRWSKGGFNFCDVEATAFEIDEVLRAQLERSFAAYASRLPLQARALAGDFIEVATDWRFLAKSDFTHAILNPPYKKINSRSDHRHRLRRAGIETVNLYSAFVALALRAMAHGGEVVAILPRSFCNGPYYRSFRDFILTRAAIRHIHLFESRNKAFKDDDVLQENVIIKLERGGAQSDVTVSTSTDDSFSDFVSHVHSFDRIVLPGDPERFIHVPTSLELNGVERSRAITYSLLDIGVEVSTGPVVDFRLKEFLRAMPEPGAVPLIYPSHFAGLGITWPKASTKKPNALQRNKMTERWLYPTGFYCIARRFSAKEEKRRIVASLVDPSTFGGALMLAFENHLNVFHEKKSGLPEPLARGLVVFLSTTAVDANFRRFNGHTQVNATDLKSIKYPSREALIALGRWALSVGDPCQEMIDAQLESMVP